MLTLGIDVGSTTTKVAFFDGVEFPYTDVLASGSSGRRTLARMLEDARDRAGLNYIRCDRIIATGYGRRLVEFASTVVSEITANARGVAYEFGSLERRPSTVIDIGGQDCKVILLDKEGNVSDFAMNDKCAAGTGRFLEVMARILEIEVEQLGEYDTKSQNKLNINSTCTVFAESEVISLLAQGAVVPDVVNAVHRSIASRIASMVQRFRYEPAIVCDGGASKNSGLVRALEDQLGEELLVPTTPQLMAAKGAAVIAASGI